MSRIPIVGNNFDFFISDEDPEITLFCCDCGLAHRFKFGISHFEDGIWMTVSARPRKTAMKRRHGNVAMLNGENKKWEMRRRNDSSTNR